MLGEHTAHHAIFEQVPRLGEDVRADIQNDATALRDGHDSGDAGPVDALEEPLGSHTARDNGPGVASADKAIHLTGGQQLPAAEDGGVRLSAQRLGRLLLHFDDLRRVNHFNAPGRQLCRVEQWIELRPVADKDNGQVRVGLKRQPSAVYGRGRPMIAAHRVEGDPHRSLPFFVFHRDRVTTLVITAVRANAVWHYRFVASFTILHLHRCDAVVAPPGALPGTGCAPLGYGHDNSRGYAHIQVKTVMLGPAHATVKERTEPENA